MKDLSVYNKDNFDVKNNKLMKEKKRNLIVFFFSCFIYIYLYKKNKFVGGLKTFDPYEILNVPMDSSD
jgi:hypothetical protein